MGEPKAEDPAPAPAPAADPEAERKSKTLDPRLNDIMYRKYFARKQEEEEHFFDDLMKPEFTIRETFVPPPKY